MRRTTVGDLAVPFFIFGIAAYVLLRMSYGSIPPLRYVISLPLAGLAVVQWVAARRVRAAVRHDPSAKPMDALVIARLTALGKASALVGAGIVGVAVALFARVVPEASRVRAASNDLWVAIFLAVGAGLLVATGLLLERAGVDPGSQAPSEP
jgi:hypothetical protein